MNDEKAVPVESMENCSPVFEGVTVLAVDADSACLTLLSRMLYKLGYKVLTAKRACDALSIAQKKENELHLLLTEVHLPDMDKYELLERMRAVSKLPVVIMSDDDDANAMLGGLFKGAVYYIVKPLTMDSLKNLWQFAFISNRDAVTINNNRDAVIDLTADDSSGEFQQEYTSNEGLEIESIMKKEKQISHRKSLKRKNPEGMNKDKGGDNSDSTCTQKKPKMVWTNELHKKFVQAVTLLGVDSKSLFLLFLYKQSKLRGWGFELGFIGESTSTLANKVAPTIMVANLFLDLGAHPKKILQHMNVPGLRKENVSSHLQKYRLSLKREQEEIMMRKARETKESSFPASPLNFPGGSSNQFPNRSPFTSTAYQPEIRSHCRNPSSNMTRPSPGSTFVLLAPPSLPPPAEEQENHDDIFGLGKQLQTNDVLLSPQWKLPSLAPTPATQEQKETDMFGIERGDTDDLFDIAKGTTQQFHDVNFDDFW
ncbi:two-component response regulator ARR2-like [Pyrus x bretschneideri]|uniref:two-component response regulator ARR2-like n=1 Tax=Pyrus x bretschneideri TaxID=225117 RepID=UPI00202E8204|nr:two-component response regulator ARR2-like [Pyrus x bretschneideri]